ncbi:MAG: cupin domain-containing protein [Candidatus Eremiobacteraeota bacterium]|nr:cupin domain-containing protein [Candidatus Eremiobacteraeota bacterium]
MTTTAATTFLRVFSEGDPQRSLLQTTDADVIASELRDLGVRFERWNAGVQLEPGANQEAVIEAYRSSVDRLMDECGYRSVDVIRVEPGTPNVDALRTKFLDEHQHAEDEVRFFVEGRGAFYLHAKQRVYQVVCVRGDLISVPAGTKHWFDMGPDPALTAIRFFINPDGWVARFTGDTVASRFPKLDD